MIGSVLIGFGLKSHLLIDNPGISLASGVGWASLREGPFSPPIDAEFTSCFPGFPIQPKGRNPRCA